MTDELDITAIETPQSKRSSHPVEIDAATYDAAMTVVIIVRDAVKAGAIEQPYLGLLESALGELPDG